MKLSHSISLWTRDNDVAYITEQLRRFEAAPLLQEYKEDLVNAKRGISREFKMVRLWRSSQTRNVGLRVL